MGAVRQTGSVYDYLNYKLQQARDKEGRAPMQISTSGWSCGR